MCDPVAGGESNSFHWQGAPRCRAQVREHVSPQLGTLPRVEWVVQSSACNLPSGQHWLIVDLHMSPLAEQLVYSMSTHRQPLTDSQPGVCLHPGLARMRKKERVSECWRGAAR